MNEADVATFVRRAREDTGLSQRELARRAGVQQPNLAAIESGKRVPGTELLDRILHAAELRPSISLELNAERIRKLAPRYGLSEVRVFGSTVHGTDTASSDVDLLVNADADVDYLTLAAFRQEAAEILRFPVDAVVDDPESSVVAAIRADAVPL